MNSIACNPTAATEWDRTILLAVLRIRLCAEGAVVVQILEQSSGVLPQELSLIPSSIVSMLAVVK